MTYTAPVAEQRFVLETVADLEGLARLPPFSELTPDLLDSVLEGAAQLSGEVFAPLNRVGDKIGARWEAGTVTMPAGFAEAYQQYAEGGWSSLAADPAFGGQGLPFVVACAVQEQLTSANMGFALCMMLTTGAIEALEAHASPAQKELYLSRLVSGQWTGTMQLTEPQAGSDVGAVRTRAERQADGTYLIKGQKIFITWGEHDCAENIIHMVLARTPDAPPGTRGLSLFIVPKFLVDEAGNLGERNDVTCASIEHKLGIHSSPTCTMSFGDNDRCVGYLVGEECRGMAAMFTMMNNARVNVGLQGVAIAERAYQGAVAYAKTRVQSVPYGSGGKSPTRIIEHPDIRRLLLTVRACTEACRALTYLNAAAIDRSHAETDAEAQRRAQGLADLLTPITKGFATDMGVELSSLALQVYGGMGYVEESGAPQHYRDSRIAPIYEGTNGIQALDLIGRKLSADGGARCRALLDEIEAFASALPTTGELAGIAPRLRSALVAARSATDWLLACQGNRMRDAAAGATPYLRLLGLLVGGWLLAKQAQVALDRMVRGVGDREFLAAKLVSARFYANQILPQTEALVPAITDGADVLFALKEEQFGA